LQYHILSSYVHNTHETYEFIRYFKTDDDNLVQDILDDEVVKFEASVGRVELDLDEPGRMRYGTENILFGDGIDDPFQLGFVPGQNDTLSGSGEDG